MFSLRLLIIFHVISACLSFDVEIEGIVRLGKDIFKSYAGQSDAESMGMPHPIHVRSRSISLPKKFPRSAVMRATSVASNRSNELMEYVDHVRERGAKIIKGLGKDMMKELGETNGLKNNIALGTDEYVITMQKYMEYVLGLKTEYVIEEEFTFLDMVETACRQLYRAQKKLLNDFIIALNTNTNSSFTRRSNATYNVQGQSIVETMSQNIYRQHIRTKSQEFRYICSKYEICRPFPALSDYFADFIVDILRLPNAKLEMFIKLIRFLSKTNEAFFNKISEEEDRELIYTQMSEILRNVYSIQESLSVVRAVLTQRFKIIPSPNLKLKMKTRAVRMLIDIFDKAFQYERDETISIDFDSTVKALRSWVNGDRPFPESVIIQLVNHIVKTLDYNLSKNAKKELSVLIETIIRGTSRNEEMFRNLFSDGSKYVRGEDFHADLEII